MIVIGVSGLARSGKDVYCKIVSSILKKNGMTCKKYAFADVLKSDVESFLLEKCGCDVWTDDTEIKTDIRDFLVWYGTTWWRKRQPDRWIQYVQQKMNKDSEINVGLISDVRFPNEGYWVHSKEGWLVHISQYIKESPDGGKTWKRIYQTPPNEHEAKNDPLIKDQSDFKIQWERLSMPVDVLVENMYLREEVFKSLKACPYLSQLLTKI